MEDQIPSSIPPQNQAQLNELPPDFLEQLKARAREEAVRQTVLKQQMAQVESQVSRQSVPAPPVEVATPQPSVVYIRRNLTVAELIVVFAIACGLVTGIQAIWNTGSRFLPSIEIRVK
jgi:hypothetical protein